MVDISMATLNTKSLQNSHLDTRSLQARYSDETFRTQSACPYHWCWPRRYCSSASSAKERHLVRLVRKRRIRKCTSSRLGARFTSMVSFFLLQAFDRLLQSYRFIKELTSATLDDLPNLEKVGVGYEHGIIAEGAIFDAINLKEYTRFGNGHTPNFIRADRSRLREWLQTNVNIRWGKRFTHFEQNEDGVTAYFDDGTSCRGDVLVGADGINSRVRDQLITSTSLKPKPVPLGMVVGEVDATEKQFKRWTKLANTFFIGYAGSRRMFVGLKSVAADGKSARYYWFFFW